MKRFSCDVGFGARVVRRCEDQAVEARTMGGTQDALAGAASGAAGMAVGHPLDTIKTRIQTAPRGQYTSALHCARLTVAERGVRGGLMAGVSFPVIAKAADKAVHFGARQERASGPAVQALAGASSGVLASFITCPAELIKVQMQLGSERNTERGALACARNIMRVQGWKGLWYGIGATAARDGPAIATWLVSYDLVTKGIKKVSGELFPQRDGTGAFEAVLAGGTAGTIAWCCSFPFDMVKSKIQAVNLRETKAGRPPSISSVARAVMQDGGVRALYAGLGPCLLRAFPVNATIFATYETVKLLFSEN